MIRINLLPFRAARKKENIRRQVSYYLGSVGLVLVIMLYLVIQQRGELSSLKERKQRVEGELATYEATIKKIESLEKQIAEITKKLNVIKELEEKKTGPVRLLDQVAMAVPKDKLFLTEFVEKGGKLTLTGTAMDNETISLYMTELEKAELITDVGFKSAKTKTIANQKLRVSDFSLECTTYAHKKEEPAPEKKKKKK
jgi:type IV pilus assembly protein PilN